MNNLTKQEYEANPKAYWNMPHPIMEETKNTPSDMPLWVKYVQPEILKNTDHDLCLDLGCGGGRYITSSAMLFSKIIGIDFSESSLEIAKDYMHSTGAENIEFYNADLGDIKDIPDASADFAYSIAVFMHMPNETKRRALKELYRVLKPGGRAVLIEIVPLKEGAFDCPDIRGEDWRDMIDEAGLEAENIGPADPFTKFKLRRRE